MRIIGISLALALVLGGCSVTQRAKLHTLPPPAHHFPAQVKKAPATKMVVQPALPVPAPAAPHKLTFKERWGTFKHKHPRWFR